MAHGRACFKTGDSPRKARATKIREKHGGKKSTKIHQVRYRMKVLRGRLRKKFLKAAYYMTRSRS